MTNSANEAVARRTRRALATQSELIIVSSSSQPQPRADIHATVTPILIQQSEKTPNEQKGLDDDASARQGRKGLWRDVEVQELRRLVSDNTGPTGNISWVKIVEAWKNLHLSERSKASLMAKWRDVNLAIRKKNDPKTSQGGASSIVVPPISDPKAVTATLMLPKKSSVCASPKATTNNKNNKNSTTDTAVVDISDDEVSIIFHKYLRKAKKIGCKPNSRKPPQRISGRNVQPLLDKVDRLLEQKIGTGVDRISWSWLSILVYAGAMTVSEIDGIQHKESRKRAQEWFKNANREIDTLRTTIGRATAELNRRKSNETPTNTQVKNIRMLMKRYGAKTFAEITSLAEKLKVRLQLLRSRIALRKADEQRQQLRKSAGKVLFRGKDNLAEELKIDISHVRKYWKSIVGITKSFDHKNNDLVAWAASLKEIKEQDNLTDCLNHDLWKDISHKAKPWKAHGPDGLQGFWWKVFKSANDALYRLAHHHLTTGSPLPDKWITEGRIVLIHKSGPANDPSNYRPIMS